VLTAADPAFEKLFGARYEAAKQRSSELEGASLAERLSELPREAAASILEQLSRTERARLLHEWGFWSRPKQRVPEDRHRIMLWLAGRRFGKNKAAAERVRERIYAGAKSLVIIGATWREVLRYQVGGKPGSAGSGILDVFPPEERAGIELKEQKGEIVFREFGATAYLVSDEQPELRGGGYDTAWLDEVIKWRHLLRLWNNLEFAMSVRGMLPPEIMISTTPRPMRFLKELIADPETITILGSSDENAAHLDPGYIQRLEQKYGGSRLAKQERYGEILSQNEDALFHQDALDATRVLEAPKLKRVVVAVDPAIATNPENDETGIVAIGLGEDDHLYVLEDASGRFSPEEWASAALRLYDRHGADAFVAERNRGGDLVAAMIRATIREERGKAAAAKVIEVHATRGKVIRAEPVSVLHEQGRLHMVGVLPQVEAEITEWSPKLGGVSPNRLDALVWGAFELAGLGVEPERTTTADDVRRAHAAMRMIQAPKSKSSLGALLTGRSVGRRL
jgi:phage terminase large subunit-like protein